MLTRRWITFTLLPSTKYQRWFASAMTQCITSTVKLNDGVSMPMFGLGTGPGVDMPGEKYMEQNPDTPRASVLHALQHGYIMIDTARSYCTEESVGQAVKESGVKREDIFLVTKQGSDTRGKESTVTAVKDSLNKLQTSYIDLFLIHSPHNGQIVETYDTLQDLKRQGLIRSVGVSNFNIHHLEGLAKAGQPLPSVNQIEIHSFQRSEVIVKFCQEKGITLMGYSPLARGHTLNDSTIQDMAKRYGKTPGQVMIRWSVQKGYITIPKSLRPERIIENSQVFDWELSQKDMDLLNTMPPLESAVNWDPTTLPWID